MTALYRLDHAPSPSSAWLRRRDISLGLLALVGYGATGDASRGPQPLYRLTGRTLFFRGIRASAHSCLRRSAYIAVQQCRAARNNRLRCPILWGHSGEDDGDGGYSCDRPARGSGWSGDPRPTTGPIALYRYFSCHPGDHHSTMSESSGATSRMTFGGRPRRRRGWSSGKGGGAAQL